MKKWRCTRCGYVHEGDAPPKSCPVCGAPKDQFEPVADEPAREPTRAEFSQRADVLIVGSGAAAFAAAVAARSRGASVIMLEKASETGGTTARSGGGYWIPCNRWQRQAGYEDDARSAVEYMARYSYPNLFNPDAERFGLSPHEYELIESYVENATKMADYFDDLGALRSIVEINWTGKAQPDYMDHLPENKGIRGRSIYPKTSEGGQGFGGELIAQLETWAREHGVEIVTGAEVSGILRGEDGRVVGLVAKIDDESVEFGADKGVVFGSGGYSHNLELMQSFQRGPHYGGCAVPTNTGDFIRLGGAIGAQIGNTAGAFRAQSMIEQYLIDPSGSSNVFYLIGDSMLLVNKYGRRIFDEKRNYTDRTMLHFVWDPVRAEWTNMLTFMVFDDRCAQLWQGYPPFPAHGQDMPYLIKADNLKQLAESIAARLSALGEYTGGFSLAPDFLKTLRDTVKVFNGYAKDGVDKEFGRGESAYDREWTTFPPTLPGANWPDEASKNYTMYPLADKGPYYAIILAAGTLDTNGGPVVDGRARVLDWNNNPIKGLYGAGNCIASPTANAYWGAGSTIGPALTFGYLAGMDLTE